MHQSRSGFRNSGWLAYVRLDLDVSLNGLHLLYHAQPSGIGAPFEPPALLCTHSIRWVPREKNGMRYVRRGKRWPDRVCVKERVKEGRGLDCREGNYGLDEVVCRPPSGYVFEFSYKTTIRMLR
ncbi:hypothetical protein GBA52_002614 [Prunus armeniaca]|nr:hypothetical protein GBA52_002614 [Prunus armeniaca]